MRFQMRLRMKALMAAGLLCLGFSAFCSGASADTKPASAFDWSGVYFGGHMGYGWGRFDHSLAELGSGWGGNMPAFLAANQSAQLSPGGVLGGLTTGINIQRGRIVWGLEADVTWSGIKGSQTTTQLNPNSGIPHVFTAETRPDWFATLRPRVGWLLGGQTLAYVTGGLAVGRGYSTGPMILKNSLGGIPSPDLVFTGDNSGISVGWSLGGGIEYALSRQWSLKAEYLHIDFGKKDFVNMDASSSNLWQKISIRSSVDIVRAGFNYRF